MLLLVNSVVNFAITRSLFVRILCVGFRCLGDACFYVLVDGVWYFGCCWMVVTLMAVIAQVRFLDYALGWFEVAFGVVYSWRWYGVGWVWVGCWLSVYDLGVWFVV